MSMHETSWQEVMGLLESLYVASDRLGELFPHRKFTLDGHLVGSVGEVLAAYMFGLKLNPSSTAGFDAFAEGGRKVEIKFTQGASVGLRDNEQLKPDHLLVLHRPQGGPARVVFNGPSGPAWEAAGAKQSNGQRPISLTKLEGLDREVDASQRLTLVNAAPI